MKTKIKSLLFILPVLSITSLATTLTTVSCGKEKKEDETVTVSGVVTDTNGTKLSGVNVSCNGNVVKTDNKGKYTISYNKTTDVIYFEKYGYISEVRTNLDPNQNWDVQLYNYAQGETQTISVTVTDKLNKTLPNTCVTFFPDSDIYKKVVYTDGTGKTPAFDIVVPPTHVDHAIPYQIEHKGVDYSVRTFTITKGQTNYSLQAIPYQYDIKAFVANDTANNNIIMHAYREKANEDSQLSVELTSNFINAFDTASAYIYKLTFCVTNEPSSPNATAATGNYFSITFTASKVLSVESASGIAIGAKSLIQVIRGNNYLLKVVIPKEFYDFSQEGDVGIHLASLDEKGTEQAKGTFQPFGHSQANTKSTNQLCYIRLGQNNEYFQASDNQEPEVFNDVQWWDGTGEEPQNLSYAKTGEGDAQQLLIGTVGPKYNFGYQVEFAVSKEDDFNGIYILTKYQHDQMSDYINDGYMPHFFVDTNDYGTNFPAPGFPSTTEGAEKIYNYSPFGGYWMRQYLVTGSTSAEAETYEYTQFYKADADSPKVYSKNDLIVTYIPFGIFTDPADRNINNIGISCNLHYHYTGGEWFGWNESNPTGYNSAPHFEDVASYIRFNYDENKNLTIKQYN